MAPIRIYIVTANCGRALVDRNAFGAHLFKPYTDSSSENMPDFVVLSLQEMAPLAYSFLGGSFLKPYFAKVVDAVHHATPQLRYQHVITHSCGMTGIIVLAKPGVADRIQWIEKAEVGVGVLEMGNKGAAGIRLGYGEAADPFEIIFVAAHLAAGEGEVERRNQDWENIVRNLVFQPMTSKHSNPARSAASQGGEAEQDSLLAKPSAKDSGTTGMFNPRSALFFAGDLNYRTSDAGPGKEDYRSFPQPVDSSSNPKHYSHLLEHDQLGREIRSGKTLQLLTEAPIHFPPTYKYAPEHYEKSPPQSRGNDVEATTWYWARHRYPSWCDRVFYSSYLAGPAGSLKVHAYTALPIQPTTDHRPVVFAAEIDPEEAALSARRNERSHKAPFPLNTQWREQRSAARNKEIFVGLCMYLGWTWEGNGLLVATILGAIGGWLVLRSLINM